MKVFWNVVIVSISLLPNPSAAEQRDSLLAAAEGYARLVERFRASEPARFKMHAFERYRTFRSRSNAGTGIGRSTSVEAPFAKEIKAASVRHGIRPSFLFAIVEVESNFNPRALSPKGARGLAQVMPATSAEVGIHPDKLWHPASNVEASARYVRWLADRYRGDIDRILIGYNAGPTVADGRRRVPRETGIYVTRVKTAYKKHRNLEVVAEARDR